MFGGLENHVLSHRLNEWVHPEDTPQVWKYYNELVRGEREHYRVEKPYYRNDGTVLWTNLTVSLLRDSDGRPEYQLALMEDTTEHAAPQSAAAVRGHARRAHRPAEPDALP